jgi:error-prone DNA polymerase
VATVAAFGAFCSRGIVREVGKVMGIPEESISYLSKRLHGSVTPDKLEAALEGRPELRNSSIPRERFRWVFRLAERLMDVPRNARAHSSGVVISTEPIADTVPVMQSAVDGVKIIQWDKRSVKRCFDKFDLLCLRGQDVLAKTQEHVRFQDLDFDVGKVSLTDPETYRTMRSGQLIGVPQSASPAMRQAHMRLRTEDLTDASLVQAGIRPGVGGAVKLNELIARRRGKPYSFQHPELERILGLTYGIIVFQEQVDMLLQAFGGYSSGEAEEIRESIHERRREDYSSTIRDDLIGRILSRGYALNVAEEVFDLVSGFKGYGFAQGHALAFAEISVRSVWCQQNYPAEYFAALLSAQPAGYYGPCTLANEARIRGVAVLPPDINRSREEFTVEDVQSETDPKLILPNAGIRVSLSQVSGVSAETHGRSIECRKDGPYASLFDFVARVQPHRDELERLILCGAFEGLHENRRALLWAIPSALKYAATVSYDPASLPLYLPEPKFDGDLDDFTEQEKAIYERMVLGLDIRYHLMLFERERVRKKGGVTSAEASRLAPGTKAFAVGNPIRLRFPPTSSGRRVVFFDLEDETGLLNVTCFDETYQRDGHAIICSPYVTVIGEAQDRDGHTAFLAHRVLPFNPRLGQHIPAAVEQHPLLQTADFLAR